VRRALLHALDREAIDARLFAGRQPPASGPVNPLDWVYDPDVPKYPYDPEKAKALLDEAGWRLQGGVRRNAAGEPLTLEIMTTAGNRSRELVQQVLMSQWKVVGVDVRARNQPARVFFGETVTKRQFPHMAMFAWVSAPESVPRTTLHSSMIPTDANNWQGQNYTGFRDDRVDALIDRIEVELDRDRRKAMWSELQRLYAEHLPALPLYFRADPYVVPTWLKGLRPTGHQDLSTLWVEDWRAQ
jgi:peptide/nickel transport system substrate-binding protein